MPRGALSIVTREERHLIDPSFISFTYFSTMAHKQIMKLLNGILEFGEEAQKPTSKLPTGCKKTPRVSGAGFDTNESD